MSAPLLTTKLFIPALSPDHIDRPRLIQRLGQGLRAGQKLTLVSAPAGYGKTTLLCDWAPDCGLPVAWLSLEEQDNDPARFQAYMLAALRTVAKGLAEENEPILPASRLPPGVEGLTILINRLSALPGKIVFVLDDYHSITARAIHKNLAFLIDHLPDTVHIVIATRVDPPLPIARLRGRGQMNEIRQVDLNLSLDEAGAFLSQIIERKLSEEDVAILASRTEGWITGLKMAALALQTKLATLKTIDLTDLIRTFGGSNRYILDYLTEEVLRQQPESVQTFLLCTSILRQMNSVLCDALFEALDPGAHPPGAASLLSSGSQEVLEYLEHANLFLVSLDDERRWYRYHHLFADLLRQRLYRKYPEWVQALHQQASEWYAQHGELDDAIEHALAAHQYERAADWIEQAGESWLKRGEFSTILKNLQALPEHLIHRRPALCIYTSLSSLFSGHMSKEIQEHIQAAEAGDLQGNYHGEATLLRAILAVLAGDGERTIALARRAIECLPAQAHFYRDLARRTLATGYFLSGQYEAANQLYEENARISQSVGDRLGAAADYYRLATTSSILGRLRQAEAIYQKALEIATVGQGQRLVVAVKILAGLGDLARERNHLELAEHYLLEAIELSKNSSGVYAIAAYIYLAMVWRGRGDLDRALETIQTAYQLAQEYDPSDLDDIFVQAYQTRLWIARGDLAAAEHWSQERGWNAQAHDEAADVVEKAATPTPLPPGGLHLQVTEKTTLARLYLARQQFQPALAILQPLIQFAEESKQNGYLIETLALQALAYQASGDNTRAISSLEIALTLAEPEGYLRIFADEGPAMAQLLQKATAGKQVSEYRNQLLAAVGIPPVSRQPESTLPQAAPALVEPLSERELDVLRLMRSALSTEEIARQLYISSHTVRSHQKSIYGKLDVHSRYEAIVRASELHIPL